VISFNEFTYTNVVFEGQTATLTGKFEDQGGSHVVVIDWGDGTVETVVLNPGDRTFTATHVYLDDGDASGPNTPVDVFRVTVTVTDDSGASASTQPGLFLIEVVNVAPANLSAVFNTAVLVPGDTLEITDLLFSDPGLPDVHQLRIDWGDGTPVTLVTLPVGTRNLAEILAQDLDLSPFFSHTYAQGPLDGTTYLVMIEVADDDEPLRPAVFTQAITVADGAPILGPVTLSSDGLPLNEGNTLTLSGSFTDPSPTDVHTVTIIWGDGTVSQATVNQSARTFTAAHIYTDNPKTIATSFPIQVRVTDSEGRSDEATFAQTVVNVAPSLAPITLSSAGSPILEGTPLTITGSFTDPSTADRHTVTITWGDGKVSQATVSQDAVDQTARTFTATHIFADNPPTADTSYLVEVRVEDDDGAADTLSFAQTVLNVAPTLGLITLSSDGQPLNEGDRLTVSGSFTDPSPVDSHTVTITWGDGTVSQAEVNPVTRTYTATHTYLDNPEADALGVFTI